MTRRKRVLTPSPRQEDVMTAIASLLAEGKQASATAVGERLGIPRQNASKHLLALERKGLAEDIPVTVRSGNWRLIGA